jgi:hypothetical protein
VFLRDLLLIFFKRFGLLLQNELLFLDLGALLERRQPLVFSLFLFEFPNVNCGIERHAYEPT